MKTVTLTQDLRPWRAGDDVHLEDVVAQQLVDNGEAENLRPFAPLGVPIEDRAMKPGDGKRGYRTKAA
ncbi:hypothetical protein [Rhizobium oryzicola]|uniref:Uncharacterized protein n=1 Tax=Rhizobium oryzicola TaxID=1232668 RepID=A0ABT8SVV1_9HYPH|nr:hypothetical protein [Rhizobium oryzicola]MDO1582425.1 hypothetical protein [Rhizobium oryzicola]